MKKLLVITLSLLFTLNTTLTTAEAISSSTISSNKHSYRYKGYSDNIIYPSTRTKEVNVSNLSEFVYAYTEAQGEHIGTLVINIVGDFRLNLKEYDYIMSNNGFLHYKAVYTNAEQVSETQYKFEFKYANTLEEQIELENFAKNWVEKNISDKKFTNEEKLEKINEYISKNFEYYHFRKNDDNYYKKLGAYSLYKYKNGVCTGFSEMFDLLAKNANIKTKTIAVKTKVIEGLFPTSNWHLINAVKNDNKWKYVDTTLNSTRINEKMFFNKNIDELYVNPPDEKVYDFLYSDKQLLSGVFD